MTHTYTIVGMTCNGCRSHVEETLKKVEGVTNASVDLAKAEATIEMKEHIGIEKFQRALEKEGGRYSIALQGEEQLQQQESHKNINGGGTATYTIFGMTCN
ncbi:MAG: heavy metal-associated domain-containing protein, partial [Arenibacter sp.]|nr:heavy metal-associated domain-containing protein [Arenibacter sp.]